MNVWVALIICVAILLLQINSDRKNKTFDFFNVRYAFEFYYILILPISGLFYHYYPPANAFTHQLNNDTEFIVSVLVILGFTSFAFGNYCGKRVKIIAGRNHQKTVYTYITTLSSDFLAIVFLLIGYFGMYMLMRKYGGISSFLTNIETFRNTGLIGNGIYMLAIDGFLPMSSAIYLMGHRNVIGNKKIRVIFVFLFLLTVIPTFVLGFRGIILAAACINVISYNYYINKIKGSSILFFGIIGLIILMAYSLFRGDQTLTVRALTHQTLDPKNLFSFIYRVDGYGVVGKVVDNIKGSNDFQYGYMTIFEMFTILIPRSLWPNKPIAKSVRFSEVFFHLNGGVSPTIIGETYWDFGLFGVVVILFLLGFIYAQVFKNCILESTSSFKMLIYSVCFYYMFYMAEAISGQLNSIWMSLVVVFCVYAFCAVTKSIGKLYPNFGKYNE